MFHASESKLSTSKNMIDLYDKNSTQSRLLSLAKFAIFGSINNTLRSSRELDEGSPDSRDDGLQAFKLLKIFSVLSKFDLYKNKVTKSTRESILHQLTVS